MCGGTAKSTNRPGGLQDPAGCGSDAASGAGRTYKSNLCTKLQKRARVGRGTDHTELHNRFDTLVLFQNPSNIFI